MGSALAEPLVRLSLVVVLDELDQHPFQVSPTEDAGQPSATDQAVSPEVAGAKATTFGEPARHALEPQACLLRQLSHCLQPLAVRALDALDYEKAAVGSQYRGDLLQCQRPLVARDLTEYVAELDQV